MYFSGILVVHFRFEITCIFCHFGMIRLQLETLSVLGFLRPESASATKRFSGKQKFVKILRKSLQKTTNLSKNLEKYLQRSIFLVTLQTLNLQFYRKNELHCKYHLIGFRTFYEHLLQNKPQRKKVTVLKFNVCYVAQGILPFIFRLYTLFV